MVKSLHGPPNNFSSFRYENCLQHIKKSKKYPLLGSFCNRIKEKPLLCILITLQSNLPLYSLILINEINYQSNLIYLNTVSWINYIINVF